MLVRLAIRFLLPFALEHSADLPGALVVDVLEVSAFRGAVDGLEGLGFRIEAGDFFLDGGGELRAVWCLEGFGRLNLLGVASLVLGVE